LARDVIRSFQVTVIFRFFLVYPPAACWLRENLIDAISSASPIVAVQHQDSHRHGLRGGGDSGHEANSSASSPATGGRNTRGRPSFRGATPTKSVPTEKRWCRRAPFTTCGNWLTRIARGPSQRRGLSVVCQALAAGGRGGHASTGETRRVERARRLLGR